MKKELIKKNKGKGILLFFVGVLYGGLYVYNSAIFFDTLHFFGKTFIQILPILLLVFVIMFLFNLFVTPKTLVKHMGDSTKKRGWVISIVAGVVSSGPIYMWFPLVKDLRNHGVKESFLTTFLYSRAVKIPLLPMMVYYFGLSYTIIVTSLILIFSILNGVIVSYITKEQEML
jgi:uncharacterized membrane protein YraQ (UPF0718 family)